MTSASLVYSPRVATITDDGTTATLVVSGAISDLVTQTQLTAAISDAIDDLIGGAPGALDTLNELAAALNDDAAFSATVTTALAGKVDKSTYDANTILAATSDNTPAAVTVGEQTLVGRITGGSITALSVAQVLALLGVTSALAGANASTANFNSMFYV